MKITDVVYLEPKKGMIFGKGVSFRSVSRGMARALFEDLGEVDGKGIRRLMERTDSVAVINGAYGNALEGYLLSGVGDGTVIRKRDA